MKSKRIPSLDGLRAVSIALVIVGHLYRTVSHVGPHTPFWLVAGNASLGVSIFFVISGFLITSLLLREHERYAAISLRNFYLRRFFRIFPGFYAYVGCIALLGGFGLISLTRADLVSAATFTWEYSRSATSWALEHLWSLSVEEQFYILWPSTLAILLRRSDKLTAAKVAGALIILGPISRVVTHFNGGPFYASHSYYLLHTRLDTLMFGCLCALLEGTETLENLYRAVAKVIWIFPIFVLVLYPLLRYQFGDKYLFVAGYTLEGFGIATTMLWLVRNSSSLAGRILNTPVLVYMGVLSYSLYLWQQLFLNPGNTSITGRFPIGILCVVAVAMLSYHFVERPFLQYRTRFERLPVKPAIEDQLLPQPVAIPLEHVAASRD